MRKLAIILLLACSISAGGAVVSGRVTDTEGRPLRGVQVSDGYAVTLTGRGGRYSFDSEKACGYVFVTIPSGYEAPLEGIFPQFWQPLSQDAGDEQHDFVLSKVSNDDHVMLVLGDFHLCHRASLMDFQQFEICMGEINDRVTSLRARGRAVYVMQLGDMTWDLYWDDSQKLRWCNFDLPAYRAHMDTVAVHVPYWHVMGNHDNDYRLKGDWDAAGPYRSIMGPTWYSFNLGGFHYIVLDNIICANDGTVKGRSNTMGVTDDQLEWVRRDMANVPAGVPVVVGMHGQVYRLDSAVSGHPANKTIERLNDAIGESHRIHYVTGDSHIINNHGKPSDRITEHNAGAVCGDWWWTGRQTFNGIFPLFDAYKGSSYFQQSRDGAPSGYTIYEMSGSSWTSQWKGFGIPEQVQLKTYDRNCIVINSTEFPGEGKYAKAIDADAGEFARPASDNRVLMNIWNFDPSWTISVVEKETGKSLEVKEKPGIKDPMVLVTYNAARYAEGKPLSSSFVANKSMHHIFEVHASSPSTTLLITLVDGFGRTYTEEMTRPKPFGIDWN